MAGLGDCRVVCYGEGGAINDITSAVCALEWGDLSGELAARAVITLAAVNAGGVDAAKCARLNAGIGVLAGGREVFHGVIWDYALTDGRRVRLCCYDRLIYLSGSRDSAYFPAGLSTAGVIGSICRKWGVPLSMSYAGCVHARISYRGISVAEQIVRTLDAARAVCGRGYMLRMEGDALRIGGLGEGGVRCAIGRERVKGYVHRRDMSGIVTRVIITADGGDGPVRTRAALDGDLTLGVLQDVIDGAGASLKDAREQARRVLAERGAPREVISLECLDEPWLRRGDLIRIDVGSVSGEFDVAGVTHDRGISMHLEVMRHAEAGAD